MWVGAGGKAKRLGSQRQARDRFGRAFQILLSTVDYCFMEMRNTKRFLHRGATMRFAT